jgi:bifunctional non-homologous end joining protein LigD
MTLDQYRNRRDFQKSNEPPGTESSPEDAGLRFVVHKHHASHLHYDLRLELDGVLKSWAVPKGMSLDPSQKRLAIMVEDHPFDYRNFEGVIPEGNYGAGTVMIWDEGWYEVPGAGNKISMQSEMSNQLTKGHTTVLLHGQKLRGEYQLIRLKKRQNQNNWLLFKKVDDYSSADAVLDQRSVRTARTMDEIRSGITELSINERSENVNNLQVPGEGSKRLPVVRPMLAYLIEEPFDRKGWIFEIKWDGYRAIAEIENHSVKLYSRNGKRLNDSYPQVVKDLKTLHFDVILDGELVIVNNQGKADFETLQNYGRTQKGTIRYYVFDLLYFNGNDLRSLPLLERKEKLKNILPPLPCIFYNEHVEEFGNDFFKVVKENSIEGMMAKDGNSPYIENKRTRYWLKVKTYREQDFVIGGFTEPKGGRTGFGALLIGIYQEDRLRFTGHVGGGFTDNELREVFERLTNIETDISPFDSTPILDTRVTWIQPVLVCQVKFAEWTTDGLLRQPVFMRFRDDIDPLSVQRDEIDSGVKHHFHLSDSSSKDVTVLIGKRSLRLTNLNKVFWPDDTITKGALIDYYQQVATIILPHLKNRPQSLHRFPDGIKGPHFFQKDVKDSPDWMETVTIDSDSHDKVIRYLLCQDEASLVYIINLGSIELNIWNSRIPHLNEPDYMVVDIDPLNCPFSNVIRTAVSVHKVMEEVHLPHYLKTSGATGLHIFVPLNHGYSYAQARQFSEIICIIVNKLLPEITSLERSPQKRYGKVYLDFLQNSSGKTMAAPYCVRPQPHATVSTPLLWEELRNGITPEQFTIKTILSRIDHYGDLWKPLCGDGIDIEVYLPRLQSVYASI